MKHPTLNTLSFFFVFVGALLLLENFHLISSVSIYWPLVLVFIGAGFIGLFKTKSRNDLVLLWLGSFVISLGLFFMYFMLFGWGQMAFLWPFFFLIISFSFASVTFFTKHIRVFIYLTILFLLLFIGFYLVFSVSLSMWPILLVFFGLSVLGLNYSDNIGALELDRKDFLKWIKKQFFSLNRVVQRIRSRIS